MRFQFFFILLIFLCTVRTSAVEPKEQVTKKTKLTLKEKNEQNQIRQTQKALWLAHILRRKQKNNTIDGLKIKTKMIPVFLIPKGNSFRPLVKIKMIFHKPKWKLFVAKNVPAKKTGIEGEYFIYAYLNSRISQVNLYAQDEDGNVQKETMFIFAPEAQEFKMVTTLDSILFTVGGANLVYSQTTFGTFSGKTGILGLQYHSPQKKSKWGYFGEAEMTVLTVSSTPDDHNPQFFDLKIGGTYAVKLLNSPFWTNRLTFGASALGLISNGSPFGFSPLYGPHLGLKSEFFQSRKNSYKFTFQLTPYSDFSLQSQRTFKLTAAWQTNLSNLRRLVFTFGYTNNAFQSGIEKISTELLTLTVGFSL